jgi:S1-C subfamily serine protease
MPMFRDYFFKLLYAVMPGASPDFSASEERVWQNTICINRINSAGVIESIGTGFFIGETPGLVLTSDHLVPKISGSNAVDAGQLFAIRPSTGERFTFECGVVNKKLDLALLKITPNALKQSYADISPLKIADGDVIDRRARVGVPDIKSEKFRRLPGSERKQKKLKIAFKRGAYLFSNSEHLPTKEIAQRNFPGWNFDGCDFTETTLNTDIMCALDINKGNSGSPVVNDAGDVLTVLSGRGMPQSESFRLLRDIGRSIAGHFDTLAYGPSTRNVREFVREEGPKLLKHVPG